MRSVPRWSQLVGTLIFAVLVGLAAYPPASGAGPGVDPDQQAGVQSVDSEAAVTPGPAPSSRANQAQLEATIAQAGVARVLVGIDVPFVPEGHLANDRAVQAQQAAIARGQDALVARLAGYNATLVAKFSYIPYLAFEVDSPALAALYADKAVTSVDLDELVAPDLAESVPLIGATNAWTAGYTGAGWTVAILDSGVDSSHPFLTGKVVSEACYSTTSAADGSTTVCPNGQAVQEGAGAGVNCSASIAGCGHGTHVAGIAAGHSYGAVTFSGVAKDASIIAIQVFSRYDDWSHCTSGPPCLQAYTSDIIKGLERVYTLRASYSIAAVNMSLGGSYPLHQPEHL